jgi:hypothetical protein
MVDIEIICANPPTYETFAKTTPLSEIARHCAKAGLSEAYALVHFGNGKGPQRKGCYGDERPAIRKLTSKRCRAYNPLHPVHGTRYRTPILELAERMRKSTPRKSKRRPVSRAPSDISDLI